MGKGGESWLGCLGRAKVPRMNVVELGLLHNSGGIGSDYFDILESWLSGFCSLARKGLTLLGKGSCRTNTRVCDIDISIHQPT